MPPVGGGVEGGVGNFNRRLRDPPQTSILLQVPWESSVDAGRRLVRGGAQPKEGAIEVGATNQSVGNRGLGCPDVGKDLRDLLRTQKVH